VSSDRRKSHAMTSLERVRETDDQCVDERDYSVKLCVLLDYAAA
jgi:hypothetical protein